jgi:DNA repair exonuclease SbcCD nuclease subunit
LRAIVFADAHTHNYQSHSVTLPSGNNSRLEDGLNAIAQVESYAKSHGIELILFLGDVFQARGLVSVSVFNQTFEAYERLSKVAELVMVVGNHDLASMYGNIHSIQTFSRFAEVIDTPRTVRKLGIDFCGIPFSSNAEEVKAHIKEFASGPNPKVLLLHQGIDGAFALGDITLYESLKKEDLLWRNFEYVFSGHYHMRQWLGLNIMYPGCLYPLTFADVNDPKGFLDVNFRNHTVKFVEVKAPKFVSVEWKDFKDGKPEIWEAIEGNIVKVYVRDGTNIDEVKQTVLAVKPSSLVVEVEKPVSFQKRTELSIAMGTDELIEQYVKSDVVPTEGYNKEELIKVGREIVRAVGQ